MIVTYDDIQDELGVTRTQIEMMIYSGAMPRPQEGKWNEAHIRPYLEIWQNRLDRAKPKASNQHIEMGCLTFPRHTR